MGKQNNNFEYYKPQNGSREGLIIPSDSNSDDLKDSDSKTMFKLPKRKYVRKKDFRRKRNQCCSEIFGALVPFVIALFVIGTLVSIGYILLGVNGMRREIELLRIQLNKVKSDEQSDLLQSKTIQNSLKRKLSLLSQDEIEIASLKEKVKFLSSQVKVLNSTLFQMKSQKDSSNIPVTIKTDLALLKKGMADTGGEIKKLSDESEGAKSTIKLLSKIVKALKKEITHLKNVVSGMDTGTITAEPVDTLKPFVPTTSPVDKAHDERRSLKKLTVLVKKLVNGYSELFDNKTRQLNLELSDLRANVQMFNKTVQLDFISLKSKVDVVQNITNKQEGEIDTIIAKLDSKTFMSANTSSDGNVLKLFKGILTDLRKHQQIIANLTGRVATMEKGSQDGQASKREESDTSEVDASGEEPTGAPDEKRPSTPSMEKTETAVSTAATDATTSPTTTKQSATEPPTKAESSSSESELSPKSESPAKTESSSESESSGESKTTNSAESATTSETTSIPGISKPAITNLIPPTTTANGQNATFPYGTESTPPTGQPNISTSTRSPKGNVSDATHIVTPSLNKTVLPTDNSIGGPSTNVTNIDSTAENVNTTGTPIFNTSTEKRLTNETYQASTSGVTAEPVMEQPIRRPESDMGRGEGEWGDADRHSRILHGSDLDRDDQPSENEMNADDFDQSRSKHGADESNDGFDALDQLDNSV